VPYSFAGFCGVALCAMSAFGELGGNTDRLLLADLRLMRLRTADVAANVCIRDERGAVADPKRTSALAFAHPQSKFRRAYPTPPPDSWVC
jgi:hypothetical protein